MDEKKRAKKVIETDVSIPMSRKIKDAFIQTDGKSVGNYVLFDVLIPSAKRIIYDLGTKILGFSLYGDKKGVNTNQSYNYGGLDYSRPYQPVAFRSSSDIYKPVNQGISQRQPSYSGYDYETWVFNNRGDVEAVLNQLTDIIESYGVASIMDLYDSVGRSAPYTADNFGWKTMNGCEPKLGSEGWRLSMTKPIPINK